MSHLWPDRAISAAMICQAKGRTSQIAHEPYGRGQVKRMKTVEKAGVLAKVASSPIPRRRVLRDLSILRSIYYRWLSQRTNKDLRMMKEAASLHRVG